MNNFMQKGKAWLVAHKSLAIFVAAVLVLGIILAVVLSATVGNVFRAGRVDKINFGDDYAQVVNALGKPNELTSGDTEYNYYSKNVTKKMEQLHKLEDELENIETWDDVEKLYQKVEKLTGEIAAMEYKYITVNFSNGKVSKVTLDKHANGSDGILEKREASKIVFGAKNVIDVADLANGTTPMRTYYSDGSYTLTTMPNNAVNEDKRDTSIPSSGVVTWQDGSGKEHREQVKYDDSNFKFKWSVSTSGWDNVVSFSGGNIPSMSFYRFFGMEVYPWVYKVNAQGGGNWSEFVYVSELKFDENVLRIPDVDSLLPEQLVEKLEKVTVDKNNPNYASLYGILFNKELTEILYVPAMNEDLTRALLASNMVKDGPTYINNVLSGYKGEMPENFELEIKAGTTAIAENALANCENLKSVSIPASVTSIGSKAFANCVNLEEISVSSGNSVYRSDGNCVIERKTGKLVVGCGSSVIPDDGSVTGIGSYAFCGSAVTEIVVPASVTAIELGAFEGCNSLEAITLPLVEIKANLYDFGYMGYVFGAESYRNSKDYLPESLKSVTISGGKNSEIAARTFSGCEWLENIVIGDGVKTIAKGAFADCVNLVSVTLPFVGYDRSGGAKYEFFGYVFGASSYTENPTYVPETLKTVVITDATSIASSAFRGCANLTSVTIGSSVKSIGRYAFNLCNSLESLTLPFVGASRTDTEYNFFGYVFNGMSSYGGVPSTLTTVTITDTTKIADKAFWSCSKIVSITLPENLVSIGAQAFESCSKLASITIPASVNYIGQYAFRYCSALKNATFENPSGWWFSSDADGSAKTGNLSESGLSNTKTAAQYLASGGTGATYVFYYWFRT